MRTERRATAIGAAAVLMWATIALFTTLSGAVPPFQLVAMSFAIAFVLALVKWVARGEAILGHFRQPLRVWALGVGGLFGFHFLYFLALRNAPQVEANFVNHLWPLLIVLVSAALPGEQLRWWHVAGAVAGLLGAALLVTDGATVAFQSDFALGYVAAVG